MAAQDPMHRPPLRPTRQQLLDAKDTFVPDLIGPKLRVLFSGINPSLYSAAVGHHFARPGNRFWPALFASGFTPRLFSPAEERLLIPFGLGITNVVSRATAAADELSRDEYASGAKKLIAKVKKHRPIAIAILGVGAYRIAFSEPRATIGKQSRTIGSSIVWVLPNPSGLNAHYQPAALALAFAELREAVE